MKLIIAGVSCLLILACSRAAPGKSNRIIGGKPGLVGAFPYQVSLRDAANEHFCGGSILNPTTILTAAQCVCDTPRVCTTVVAGTRKIKLGQGLHHVVANIICHGNYDRSNGVNDIAIIKLRTPLPYSQNVAQVRLPAEDIAENQKLTLSGWGLVGWGATGPKKTEDLQHIQLKTINLELCLMMLQHFGREKVDISGLDICTVPSDGAVGGACNGDAGGPLVSKEGIQYGIDSWIDDDCTGTPDVFVNVHSYISWIQAYM